MHQQETLRAFSVRTKRRALPEMMLIRQRLHLFHAFSVPYPSFSEHAVA